MRRLTGVPSPAPAKAGKRTENRRGSKQSLGRPHDHQPDRDQPENCAPRGLAGLAGLGGLVLFPGQLLAATAAVPGDPFILLLKGLYHPLVNPPNLRLTTVNLNDGSYSTVKIYPQRGVPGHTDKSKAIGNFYTQDVGDLVAYNLPKGSLAMRFLNAITFEQTIPDGSGGNWLVGNFNLTILEGTGIYRSFVGGHNLMVDILHQLADQSFVEHCVCIISRP